MLHLLGMTQAASIFDSPVGPLAARAENGRLTELSFHTGARVDNHTANDDPRNVPVLELVRTQISEYFARKRTHFEVPLEPRGTDFYRRVWAELLKIPYGHTWSYGQLAANIGMPDMARAVGAANGANPIAIIVPCHRVIGADGSLVGYGGGLSRKRLLLDLESDNIRLPFAL